MPHPVSWIDRLRIERFVWALDQRLIDLPRATRIAHRREVRENLLTASAEVGTTAALEGLGDTRRLAAGFVDAEFGDEARPHLITAALILLTSQLILMSLFTDATIAFADGLKAADPGVTGTFHWPGISFLQDDVTFTAVDGDVEWVGGAYTPLMWCIFLGATVVGGRLWRLVPQWRRRRKLAATSV